MKKSAFVRRGDAGPAKTLPRGTYPNAFNAQQLLCSHGLHAWDELAGGGALVGGMSLVVHDQPTRHWKALVRFYVAQALHDGHAVVLVGAADYAPAQWVRAEVPLRTDSAPVDRDVVTHAAAAADSLQIAWRYRAQVAERPLGGSEAGAGRSVRRAQHYDLSRADADAATRVQTLLHTACESPQQLFARVAALVEAFTAAHVGSAEAAVPIMRVVLLGFGSGAWWSCPADRAWFVARVRALVRHSLAAALWTAPPAAAVPEVRHCFDHVVALRSFAAAPERDQVYVGFHGVLELQRTPALFAASHSVPHGRQFLYRRTRRSLHVERLYLPPEDAGASPGLGCATSGGTGPLDF